jgi:NADPH-dependent glutamate synthase beta subunit-like oxidoreductase
MIGTDIHEPALDKVAEWQKSGLKTVHVVGRRGFVQAAFTNAELRELLTFDDDVLAVVDPAELALCRNPASETELSKNRAKKRAVSILDKMAENFAEKDTTNKRVLWLRFLWSPSAVLAGGMWSPVAGVRLDRTELTGEPGKQKAESASSEEYVDVECNVVVRSVGFDINPFEGLALENGRVPHENGRVSAPMVEMGGLYVSGWVKRGPTGKIASNIEDAQETAQCVLKDLVARDEADNMCTADVGPLEARLQESAKRVVSFEDWRYIEDEEQRLGEAAGRVAVKFTDVPEMLRLLEARAE